MGGEFWRSRGYGLLAALALNYPLIRGAESWAKNVWKVTKNSSYARKVASDISFAIPVSIALVHSSVTPLDISILGSG